jgi:hypothetical protein
MPLSWNTFEGFLTQPFTDLIIQKPTLAADPVIKRAASLQYKKLTTELEGTHNP